MSSSLLKYISLAMLLASAFWVSESSAISVPYHPDSKAAIGLVNYPPFPERPFAFILSSTEEQQTEMLDRLHDNEQDHYLRDEHSSHGNGHSTHGDQNDVSSDDNTSNTPIPPVPCSYQPVTASVSAVPVPAALWLFLSGIIGLGVTVKSRHR